MKTLTIVIVSVLATSLLLGQLHAREVRQLEHTLDTLASNEILRRAADSLRWETALASVTDDLSAALTARDSLTRRTAGLIETIESLEGRVLAATEVNINLIAALRSDSARSHGPTAAPDSITAPYDDGLLYGRIAYYPPDHVFGLEYQALIRGSLVTTELPDGRWSVMALAEDPERIKLSLPRVYVRPPAPVEYCSVMTKGKWSVIGWLLGVATPG